MTKEKKERTKKEKLVKEEIFTTRFSDLISKITVTKNTPHGLLAEWQKEYNIDNCQVIVKLNDENK